MNVVMRAALVGLLLLAHQTLVNAQTNLVILTADFFPDRSGTPYDFFLSVPAIDLSLTLTGPDGSLFEPSQNGRSLSYSFDGLSAADLSRFVGQWTINDSYGLPAGSTPKKHTFNVSTVDLTAKNATPRIISPVDGETLPHTFSVETSHGGFRMHGHGVRIENLSDPFDPESLFQASLLPGFQEGTIVARANNQDVTIRSATASGLPARRFGVWTVRNTLSLPSTWTVAVPEPTSFAMCATVLGTFAALLRRK